MNDTKPDFPWDDPPRKYATPPPIYQDVPATIYQEVPAPPAEIAFACGHTSPRPDSVVTAATIAWMAENGQCRDCWKQRQRTDADNFDAENDLPALRGTDNQIAWASSLRHEALDDIQARHRSAEALGRAAAVKKHAKTLEGVREITSAAAWIAAREVSPEALLAMVQARLRPRKRTPR